MTQFDSQDGKKKGGILAAFLKLFGGSSGSSLPGTALSGGGWLGGLGGLFTSKAGIMGVVLGGATIAAGIGVVYNFIGPSSKSVYTPGLFQDSYYESVAGDAQSERSAQYDTAKRRSSSSLDYFSEEAQKGDIDGLASEAAGEGPVTARDDEDFAAAAADADADAASQGGGAGAKPSLVKSQGFGSGGSIPRMRGGGGLSGGIGSKFQNVFKAPPVTKGKTSAMSGSAASRRISGKRSVPHFNKKGAFGQAKYAGKVSKGAAYTSSDSGAKTTAQEAFEGQTAGAGDVAGIDSGGAGLGGAGLGEGDLQASDPSLNTNESTPPTPPVDDPTDDSPWSKTTDMALYGMLAAVALIFITKMLVNKAKTALATGTPAGAALALTLYKWAKLTAYLAMAAAGVVIFAGITLMNKYAQKWMGIMYAGVGAVLMYKAYEALSGIDKGISEANAKVDAIAQNIADVGGATPTGTGTPKTTTTTTTPTTTTTQTGSLPEGYKPIGSSEPLKIKPIGSSEPLEPFKFGE